MSTYAKDLPTVRVYVFQPTIYRSVLAKRKGDTDEHADRITAVRSQIQADREIDQRTSKRLCHIIRQAHLSIRAQDRGKNA